MAFTRAPGVSSWRFRQGVLESSPVSGHRGLGPGDPGRELEQQRAELPVGEPQQERAGATGTTTWAFASPELRGCGGCRAGRNRPLSGPGALRRRANTDPGPPGAGSHTRTLRAVSASRGDGTEPAKGAGALWVAAQHSARQEASHSRNCETPYRLVKGCWRTRRWRVT